MESVIADQEDGADVLMSRASRRNRKNVSDFFM